MVGEVLADGAAQALGDGHRDGVGRVRQHERELLAAEPGGDVGAARARAQQPGELLEHAIARVVPERVVHALEVVEVADQQRERPAGRDAPVHARTEAAPVAQARERVVLGEVGHARELAGRLDGRRGLVRERAQRLQARGRGQQAVGRLVRPDHAAQRPGAVVERDDEAVAVPGPRAAAVAGRRVDRMQLLGQQRDRLVVLEQRAALLHELRVEQGRDGVQRRGRLAREVARLPADGRERAQRRVLALGQRDHDLGEAERVADARAHGAEHLGGGLPRPDLRRDAQQVLHRGAVAARPGGRLHVLQGGGRVVADGGDEREPRRVGPAAVRGRVDRHDPERLAARVDQRDQQQVLRVPRAGILRGGEARRPERVVARPVHAAGRHEVGAAVVEALQQHLVVLRPRRRRAHQRVPRDVVPFQQHDLEVVPRGPVQVDADALEARRAADRLGDRGEDRLGIAATRAERATDREDALERVVGHGRGHQPVHRPAARSA